jgi:ATP-binding cassette subfamily C (CFTR/MRP) protein 1
MAPAATFGVYALQAFLQGSESLNTVQAFTSLALIGLVTYPASRLLAAVPNVTSSIGCFDRIQAYLLTESRIDQRQSSEPLTFSTSTNGVNVDGNMTKAYSDLPDPTDHDTSDNFAIVVEKANIRPAAGADIVLRDVSLKVQIGSTVMITGPVGAGKTTLLRAILGEIPCESGTIYVKSRRAAYCSQTPWLMSGTIRAAICGMTTESVDEAWYKTVIEGCALDYDISRFPAGDQTLIGSRGVTLSGGQKQRVCLARTLYSRAEIFVLDDVLSALDKKTEKMMIDRLFGNGGLFQTLGSTVIMVTHASKDSNRLWFQILIKNSSISETRSSSHRHSWSGRRNTPRRVS